MKYFALTLLAITAAFNVAADECPILPNELSQAVARHIESLNADEYCEARSVQTEGKLSIAVYTAEGACDKPRHASNPGTCSNDWRRYMIGALDGKIIGPIEIGGKGDFVDNGITITETMVELAGSAYGPDDPMCCPSVAAVKRFRYSETGFADDRK